MALDFMCLKLKFIEIIFTYYNGETELLFDNAKLLKLHE